MRWQSLRGLRHIVITPYDVRRVVHWIMACVVLHNLLIHEPDDDIVYAEDGDGVEQQDSLDVDYERVNARGNRVSEGVAKRDAIVSFLCMM